MRTTPYHFTKTEAAPEPNETPAAEPVKETPAPAAPTAPQPPKKTFLQQYGWLLAIVAVIAAIWFFMKYKIVSKAAAVVA